MSPYFMEIIIIMRWSICIVRNDLIFKGDEPSVQKCKLIFKKTFGLVTLCVKKKYFPLISVWLEQFV
jgi:hypothetical protein